MSMRNTWFWMSWKQIHNIGYPSYASMTNLCIWQKKIALSSTSNFFRTWTYPWVNLAIADPASSEELINTVILCLNTYMRRNPNLKYHSILPKFLRQQKTYVEKYRFLVLHINEFKPKISLTILLLRISIL